MLTITETKNLYTFEELNDAAKEQAKDELLQDPYYFWGDMESYKSWEIDPHFENTKFDIKWQGDFSFCQGDGLNIYGDFLYNDLRRLAGLKPVKNDILISLEPNPRYTYCRWDMDYYGADILDTLSYEIGEKRAYRQERAIMRICETMQRICKDMRKEGEYLIFEGYLDPSIYETRLFDENGHWICSIDDVKQEA